MNDVNKIYIVICVIAFLLLLTSCADKTAISTDKTTAHKKTEVTSVAESESTSYNSDEKIFTSDQYRYAIVSKDQIALVDYIGKEKNVVIPLEIDGKKVTELRETFSKHGNIEKIILPNTISKLDSFTFFKCIGLKNIEVDEDNECFSSVDGVLYDKNMDTLIYYPDNKTDEIFVVPSSVNTISYVCKQPKFKMIVVNRSVNKIIDAMDPSANVVWIVAKGSAAEKYATDNALRYSYMNSPDN